MYCRHCGKEVNEENTFCPYCGQRIKPEKRYCPNCGDEITTLTQVCPKCGFQVPPVHVPIYRPKSKMLAGLLGIFFGCFGVHNFYLGYTSKGFLQLVLFACTPLTCGMSALAAEIWGFVEGIMIFIGHIDKDADGNFLHD